MPIIKQLMPTFRLRQVDHVAVQAPPARAWEAIEAFDASSIPYIRWLFDLRLLPAFLAARLHGKPAPERARLALRDAGAAPGFFRIEEPAREICVGSIGKFWKSNIEFVPDAEPRFQSFAEPGFGKLTWSLRVDPRTGGGSWIDGALCRHNIEYASKRKSGRLAPPVLRVLEPGQFDAYQRDALKAGARDGQFKILRLTADRTFAEHFSRRVRDYQAA